MSTCRSISASLAHSSVRNAVSMSCHVQRTSYADSDPRQNACTYININTYKNKSESVYTHLYTPFVTIPLLIKFPRRKIVSFGGVVLIDFNSETDLGHVS